MTPHRRQGLFEAVRGRCQLTYHVVGEVFGGPDREDDEQRDHGDVPWDGGDGRDTLARTEAEKGSTSRTLTVRHHGPGLW